MYLDELRAARLVCPIVPVTITAGDEARLVNTMWRVPKRDLLGDLQLMLQRGDLAISGRLAEAETLVKELRGMRVQVGAAGNETISTGEMESTTTSSSP